MKRREIIKLVALSTGAVLSTPLLGSLVSSCSKDIGKQQSGYQNLFFSEDESIFIRHLVDIILPKTDSPSATDVGVDQTIDLMIAKTYKKEDQDKYRKNLTALQHFLTSKTAFINGDLPGKKDVLLELSSSNKEDLDMAKKSFLDLKQQTIAYYLSTEEISKNYLNYLPVPGKYEPCISLEEVNNKAWAL